MAEAPRIAFDPSSETPAVRKIADSLRVLLVERQLMPGAALPSVRRLAIELGVHFNTVAEAYRELASEGWLEVSHGKAAVVLDRRLPRGGNPNRVEQFQDRLRGTIAQMRSEGIPADSIADVLRTLAKAVAKT